MNSECGFTLVEMLVGLLVLSLTAVILSGSIGNGFATYAHLKDINYQQSESRVIRKAMTRYVESRYFDQSKLNNGVVEYLEIAEEEGVYRVRSGPFVIIESQQPLRFRHDGRYFNLEKSMAPDWVVLARVLKPINVEPFCRYDIVGRRCR